MIAGILSLNRNRVSDLNFRFVKSDDVLIVSFDEEVNIVLIVQVIDATGNNVHVDVIDALLLVISLLVVLDVYSAAILLCDFRQYLGEIFSGEAEIEDLCRVEIGKFVDLSFRGYDDI